MAKLTFPVLWEVIIVCYPPTCCGLILMEFGLKVMPGSQWLLGWGVGGQGQKGGIVLKPVKTLIT